MSSYDVIRRLKKLHTFKKIGYIGTLDRNATGILPVALNEGVKLIPFLEDGEKVYRAQFLFGITTDTLDIEGKVLSEREVPLFDRTYLDELLQRFTGRIIQQIPIFSSKKINRKPLYKLAREGTPIEPQTKEVEIFDITLLSYNHPYIELDVTCSKGTYIRALARDYGELLGCGATLYTLKRTRHGEFTDEKSIDIEYFKNVQDLLNYLIPLEKVMQGIPEMTIEPALERFMKHGMPIPLLGNAKGWQSGSTAKIMDKKGALIGVGMVDMTSKTLKVKRLINY